MLDSIFVVHLSYLCLVFLMLSRLFIAVLWSPTGKGLTIWLSFVMFNSVLVSFPCGILGQVLCSLYRLLIFVTVLTLYKSIYTRI